MTCSLTLFLSACTHSGVKLYQDTSSLVFSFYLIFNCLNLSYFSDSIKPQSHIFRNDRCSGFEVIYTVLADNRFPPLKSCTQFLETITFPCGFYLISNFQLSFFTPASLRFSHWSIAALECPLWGIRFTLWLHYRHFSW